MAFGDPIPPERVIHRALSYKNSNKKEKKPKDSAFLLKESHTDLGTGEHYPAEDYLSFGLSPEAARLGLHNIPYTCPILVADILALGRNIRVTEDIDGKVRVSGMPLPSQDLDMALTIAKDLRNLSGNYE